MKGRGLTPACVQSQKGKEVKEVFFPSFLYFFDFFEFVVRYGAKFLGKIVPGICAFTG
jgi:hypothetical protein